MRRVGSLPPGEQWAEIQWRAERFGIPLATWDTCQFQHWDSLRPGKGIKEATEYAAAMAQGRTEFTVLTIAGPPGVGKTHLALAVAWECILGGFHVQYRQAGRMLDELRACIDVTPEQGGGLWTVDEKMNLFKECGVLIIDDLGVEKLTDWGGEKMDTIIDHRWLNRLPLVVTTNAKSEDLPPRIADRLGDVHRGRVVQIAAESYRKA